MLRELLKEVPSRVRAQASRLGAVVQAPETLAAGVKERGAEAQRWVKRRANVARTTGEERLWELHLAALERAGGLIERTADLPALGRITDNVQRLLQTIEAATTAAPLEGYDDLGVREIRRDLHKLDHLGLLRLRHHEVTHKARKTVLESVDKELERRTRALQEA